ncbi:MAG: glycosyltransferase family 4 protein [Pseudomonadota bacterium]
MDLLLVNFEMDPGSRVLAWQYYVACALAKRCSSVTVLTERLAPCELPENVRCYVVPRAFIKAPVRWLGAKWLMNFLVIWLAATGRVDACFIHMNMEWAYRLRGVLRFFRVPILLWYAHGTVSRRLRKAHASADRVVTSTPEGFRLPSKKLHVIGQGIPLELFPIPADRSLLRDLVTVSRLSPRKRIDLLVRVFAILALEPDFADSRLLIVGDTVGRDDVACKRALEALVGSLGLTGRVVFLGHVPVQKMSAVYATAAIHVNVSETGSMDKTVLESLACGCPVVTSNLAFRALLAERFPEFFIEHTDIDIIAGRIAEVFARRMSYDPRALRSLVEGHHDLNAYVEKVLHHLTELIHRR